VFNSKALLRHPMAKSSLAEMAEGTRFQRLIPEVMHPNPLSSTTIDNDAETPHSENWQRNNVEPRIPYSLVGDKNYPLASGEIVASPSMMDSEFTLLPPDQTTTLIFCSGQVYYLLSRTRALNNLKHIAIVRIEQFTPFPWWEVRRVVDSYTGLKEIVWCQEEPWNAGAWSFVAPRIETVLRGSQWMKSV
jgi:2-oxoglutarate dehydrogenase E1 component